MMCKWLLKSPGSAPVLSLKDWSFSEFEWLFGARTYSFAVISRQFEGFLIDHDLSQVSFAGFICCLSVLVSTMSLGDFQ